MRLRVIAPMVLAAVMAGCGGQQASRAERSASPSGSAAPTATPTAVPTATPTAVPTATPSGGSPSGQPSSPPVSTVPPATITPPPGPPKTPTDQVKRTAVVGTITVDSRGPCYRLVTDEGVEYSLHSTSGFSARRGQRVRAQIGPLLVRIHCGPGKRASATQLSPLA